jgi:uncharacterized protein YoxC
VVEKDLVAEFSKLEKEVESYKIESAKLEAKIETLTKDIKEKERKVLTETGTKDVEEAKALRDKLALQLDQIQAKMKVLLEKANRGG